MITVLNILLVEDNPGDIRLLQEILREVTTTRCQITPVMTLTEAIERVAQSLTGNHGRGFDVILLDLSLPDSHGIGTFIALHDRYPHIPIVVLTGFDDENLALSAMQQGAQDYLTKGQVDSALLLRSLRYAIERERSERALRQAKTELEQRVRERTQDLQLINDRLQRELSERHKAEAELQISRSRFAGILELASDAIISIDCASQTIGLFNRAAEHIFGYTTAEVIGQSLDLLVSAELVERYRQSMRHAAAAQIQTPTTQLPARERIVAIRKNGSRFPAEVSISHLELGGEKVCTIILRDITERQQIENNLRYALKKINFHFQNSPLAAIEWNREFRVARWSATAEKIFGWQEAVVMGKRPDEWKFIVPEDAERVAQTMQRLSAGIEKSNVTINRNYCQDGTIVNCEWYNSVLKDDRDRMESVFSLVLDVTDRDRMERMKNDFVAVVSHELRTPLTSIFGSLQMLDSGLLVGQPDKERRLLSIATANVDRLMRLVNDILDIERIESGTLQPSKSNCQVADVMAKAVSSIEPLAERAGVSLEVRSEGGQIWVDSDRIVQAFTNLLSNAIKFSPSDSTVWFTATKQAGRMLFQVRDCGRGIPKDKLGIIFERFQQVDASDARHGEGTGLGLAICRSIIQQHGGTIWAESTVGEGSTFSFILPRSPSTQDSIPPKAATSQKQD